MDFKIKFEEDSYQVRVVYEYIELKEKIDALSKELNDLTTISVVQRSLLKEQLDAMELYCHILTKRIMDFIYEANPTIDKVYIPVNKVELTPIWSTTIKDNQFGVRWVADHLSNYPGVFINPGLYSGINPSESIED